MSKYNLKDTWKYCEDMWQWIDECLDLHKLAIMKEDDINELVENLKGKWLADHDIETLDMDCFFCDYVNHECDDCPPKTIDPDFNCMEDDCNFGYQPKEFAARIKKLHILFFERN